MTMSDSSVRQSVKQHLHGAQIAEEFNVAVLITNHVMSDPSGGAMFVSDPKKPVGGHVMAHASTIRLSLRKGKGEQRLMKVVDAPNLRELLERPCLHCLLPGCKDAIWLHFLAILSFMDHFRIGSELSLSREHVVESAHTFLEDV